MMRIHQWWSDRPDERFWLEITDRIDPGTNLKAPQTGEKGQDVWSYSLLRYVRAGDLVFHYDGPSQSIAGASNATGGFWEDQIVWGARGSSARLAGVTARTRPGQYCGLEGYRALPTGLTLNEIRANRTTIQVQKDELEASVGKPLCFPFELGSRPVRPLQGYLFKLPKFFVSLYPQLQRELHGPSDGDSEARIGLGVAYREADEQSSVGQADPFCADPALVERATRAHATAQNSLARYLEGLTLVPRSPRANEPDFDLGWETRDNAFVAEVKSLTNANEEKQLRLGLGQVLRYRHLLAHMTTKPVRCVLVAERRPSDATWLDVCESLGVLLVWPERYEALRGGV